MLLRSRGCGPENPRPTAPGKATAASCSSACCSNCFSSFCCTGGRNGIGQLREWPPAGSFCGQRSLPASAHLQSGAAASAAADTQLEDQPLGPDRPLQRTGQKMGGDVGGKRRSQKPMFLPLSPEAEAATASRATSRTHGEAEAMQLTMRIVTAATPQLKRRQPMSQRRMGSAVAAIRAAVCST
ncbi:hypothetical protein Efla_005829 [Eimeria flavescens]